jgi:phosphoribosylanthranilate isomerase
MALVKICGITNWNDAKAAVDAGADMLGFVCDAHSERAIDIDAFVEMAQRIPSRVLRIGVFDRVPHQEWALRPSAVRLFHGIQYYDSRIWGEVVGDNWDMRRKIRAFHISREADLRTVANCNDLAQSYLVNVHVDSNRAESTSLGIDVPSVGGHAAQQDVYGWHIANEVHQFGRRLFLAGGLTPSNVERAVRMVRPYAVDVTVGVELAPGVKDPDKMQAFVDAVRRAST